MANPVLAGDVSYYQDPAKLDCVGLKAGGFELMIAKFSMGGGYDKRADAHIANFKNSGVKTGGYHWCDPTQNWIKQSDFFLYKIDQHKPNMVMYDVEQWWSDWVKYGKFLRREIPISQVPRLTQNQVLDSLRAIVTRVLPKSGIPKHRHKIYTARWVDARFPNLSEVIKELGLGVVNASYRTNIAGTTWMKRRYSWDEFYRLIPVDRPPLIPEGLSIEDIDLEQFTSSPILPPLDFNIDCNFYRGTKDEFFTWIEDSIPPPPPPPPPTDNHTKIWEAINVNTINIQKLLEWASSFRQ